MRVGLFFFGGSLLFYLWLGPFCGRKASGKVPPCIFTEAVHGTQFPKPAEHAAPAGRTLATEFRDCGVFVGDRVGFSYFLAYMTTPLHHFLFRPRGPWRGCSGGCCIFAAFECLKFSVVGKTLYYRIANSSSRIGGLLSSPDRR